MKKAGAFVRSIRDTKKLITYKIIEINGDKAKCLRLDDESEYIIPLSDLYIPSVIEY